ncbi:DUF6876 family protein [Roseomonas chloroacetimidivorans]|uniref:DUF6876 family protein n=1 Tax=Roseomonas chloroacetimidivorans TaxID=1766656 RepID=UPI003C74E60B
MAKLSPDEIRNRLAQHHGSDSVTRHGMMRSLYMTAGIVEMRELCDAYWLVDLVASHFTHARVRKDPFQVWKLVVNEETRQATVTMTDGNSQKPIVTQEIPFSDFPLPEFTIWVEGDTATEVVAMLPQER